MPLHALLDKKNLDGTECACTRMSDKEHTAAALGHSEILSVKDAPREIARGSAHQTSVRPLSPWRLECPVFSGQRPKEVAEGVSVVGEDAGDVLPDEDDRRLSSGGTDGVDSIADLYIGTGQLAARIVEALSQTGDGERLTRRPSYQNVGGLDLTGEDAGG
jgi:hypothetical protein